MPLESPLSAEGPALRAPPELAGCRVPSDVLRASAGHPQDPVGVQAVLPGAGGHWKREAGPPGKEDSPRGGEQKATERTNPAKNPQYIHT